MVWGTSSRNDKVLLKLVLEQRKGSGQDEKKSLNVNFLCISY